MGRKYTRREALALAAPLVAGCFDPKRPLPAPLDARCAAAPRGDFDYVVVGSGAGGGPLACNLARAGHRVLLLEAGGDPSSWRRDVPALHAQAAEEPSMRWDFFVRTYDDEARQRRNERFVASERGVLYPRAGTLGGCTAHNAMITLRPHDGDWDAIADALGDESWRARSMRKFWSRLERCDYAPRSAKSGHGFGGWLHTDVARAALAFGDERLRGIVIAALAEAATLDPGLYWDAVKTTLAGGALWDPNDDRLVDAAAEGMIFVPLHMNGGTRESTRDYVRATAASCPDGLHVELHALATRVLFDGTRAVGVEYLSGERLYRASASPASGGERREVHARREVILCGGVFNTPQLLMLSGVGPRDHLRAHGIEPVADRPGVGQNLQDRYEMSVVYELDGELDVLRGMTFEPPANGSAPDPELARWLADRNGPYATNGVVGALVKKSTPRAPVPDLFVFGIVGNFHGYFPGYSRELTADHRHFTWAVLKAHTENRRGEVTLRSSDPRDRPHVSFHYFDEGSPRWQEDLDAVVEGVVTARRIMRRVGDAAREVRPTHHVGTRSEIASYVRDNAWGHHASCTSKMGPASDCMAVVDGNFRVHGTSGLRVVDASVFPRIPGFFVVASVYMIAEKATDAILADAK